MSFFVETNGIRLHYLDHPGDGPTLLLVPGLTANCHVFDGLVAAGLGQSLRVLVPDMRGRGSSDKPEAGYTMADHAADMAGMIRAMGLSKVIMGGHSFGGLLSIVMAANYPELVERIVIIDAAIAMASEQTRLQIKPSLDRLERSYPSFAAYLDQIKQAPYYRGWQWDPLVESYYRHDVAPAEDGTLRPRSQPAHIAAAMDGVIAEPWHTHMSTIDKPALLLNAPGPYGPPGAAPIVSEAQARETADRLVNCRYVQVHGNHQTMLYGEGAAEIVTAIHSFVQLP